VVVIGERALEQRMRRTLRPRQCAGGIVNAADMYRDVGRAVVGSRERLQPRGDAVEQGAIVGVDDDAQAVEGVSPLSARRLSDLHAKAG
jgi:hypothetical protein